MACLGGLLEGVIRRVIEFMVNGRHDQGGYPIQCQVSDSTVQIIQSIHPFPKYLTFFFYASAKYRIVPESITPNSVTARMIPKPGTAVTLPYAARIKGGTAEQICLIPPAATVLQCKIEGLKACTEYTLELLPCDPAAGPCDSVDEKTFTTDAAPCRSFFWSIKTLVWCSEMKLRGLGADCSEPFWKMSNDASNANKLVTMVAVEITLWTINFMVL